jgi:hypothetical protein
MKIGSLGNEILLKVLLFIIYTNSLKIVKLKEDIKRIKLCASGNQKALNKIKIKPDYSHERPGFFVQVIASLHIIKSANFVGAKNLAHNILFFIVIFTS